MGLANLLEADTISNPFTSVHTLGMAAVLDTCSREMRGLPRPGRLRPGGHHCRSQWTLKHYFGVGLIMRDAGFGRGGCLLWEQGLLSSTYSYMLMITPCLASIIPIVVHLQSSNSNATLPSLH